MNSVLSSEDAQQHDLRAPVSAQIGQATATKPPEPMQPGSMQPEPTESRCTDGTQSLEPTDVLDRCIAALPPYCSSYLRSYVDSVEDLEHLQRKLEQSMERV